VYDKTGNFLQLLSNTETARGLITFLFAVTTVGVAVILALSAVLPSSNSDDDKRFDRGKQVLTLMIGVLGTIVGFYFGAQSTGARVLTIATASLPAGNQNTPYPPTLLLASGGTPPMKWSAVPPLPAGLTLDSTSGLVSGTPTEGTSSKDTKFTFTVTDSSTPAVSFHKEFAIEIRPALTITPGTLPEGKVGQPYSGDLKATGGTSPLKWSAAALPEGLTLDPTTGKIGGIPKGPSNGKVKFTVMDGATPPASKETDITIDIKQ
jgi:hypothetical protein